MTYTLSFHPEVGEDATGAHEWYETKAKGLGEDFLRYSTAMQLKSSETLSLGKKWKVNVVVAYRDDFFLPFIIL